MFDHFKSATTTTVICSLCDKLSHKIVDNGSFISNVSINNKIRAVKQRSCCRVGPSLKYYDRPISEDEIFNRIDPSFTWK